MQILYNTAVTRRLRFQRRKSENSNCYPRNPQTLNLLTGILSRSALEHLMFIGPCIVAIIDE